MINFTNTTDLTLDERKLILKRAIASQPFFELLAFEIAAGNAKDRLYKAKFDTDKDFFITDIKGNFDEVFDATGAEFWLSVWTAYKGESVHKYIRGENLPAPFQSYEARFNLAFADQKYCDLQDEILPYHIQKGDSVLASINNQDVKAQVADCKVVVGGYFTLPDMYVNERLQEGINESLALEPQIETWKFRVTKDGIENHQFTNDRFARVVLGFGIVDLEVDKGKLAESTVSISDNVRGLKFNNVPIPVEYIAPRLTCVRDKHADFLPVEYLLEPFATLRFETNTDLNTGAGYEFIMITRTV